MEDTTTSVDGGADAPLPQDTEAVSADSPQDDAAASQEDDQPNADEAAVEEPSSDDALADPEDIESWAKKAGLPMDDPLKMAKMVRDTQQKMHEVTATKSVVQPPELQEPTGEGALDSVIERQNRQDLQLYVRDWFEATPDAKEHREELMRIASERPWLTNMDDVYAHLLANPARTEQLKKEGGREALTNLAQKQSQVPPSAHATNGNSYGSPTITSENVEELVSKNSNEWYMANRDAILKASNLN